VYTSWLQDFGHDTFQYPQWILEQKERCRNDPKRSETIDWCVARDWLLNHMPEFDKHFMPPSVSVNGTSMFDDQIAFALMAFNASEFADSIPLEIRLSYVLPYASYHEARVNWRPLFFAKFYSIVQGAQSTADVMRRLVSPNVFTNWTGTYYVGTREHRSLCLCHGLYTHTHTNICLGTLWPSHPFFQKYDQSYELEWSSSTSPPVINPFGFAAYGYGSCSAWATMLTYVARSLGVPARQVGSPCWNSVYGDIDFRGLAKDNSNVSLCWKGGIGSKSGKVGGVFLNNHNWVEFWDSEQSKWVFQNVPPTTTDTDRGPCDTYTEEHGCNVSESLIQSVLLLLLLLLLLLILLLTYIYKTNHTVE